MSHQRPGALAVRAVNQYRRRDVLTYLGLRYYLRASAARSDHWVRRVCPELVLTRGAPSYLEVYHFKEVDPHGGIEHRRLFLPGPNEALAEAALLGACGSHEGFANPSCVFSYALCGGDDRDGLFQPYFKGLRARHDKIAAACDSRPDAIVKYVDIQKCYPSIGGENALAAWKKYTSRSALAPKWIELGERLIQDHRDVGVKDERGLLTGPMFSHLIANLVLREVDEACSAGSGARYFRYVDDIVLVGSEREVAEAQATVREHLDALGLRLHDDSSFKSLTVSAADWLEGREDFRPSRRSVSWMTFVGDLKRFLLYRPSVRDALASAFLDQGMRIPVGEWSEAAREAGRVERVLRWASQGWFRRKVQRLSTKRLVQQAVWLRDNYQHEFRQLCASAAALQGFHRKRNVPKLRYRAGRLVYLASESDLKDLAREAAEFRELRFHGVVMEAVASGEVGPLLRFGTNAAQAAAHALRAAGKSAVMPSSELGNAERQGLAVMLLNGVRVHGPGGDWGADSDLIQFARVGGTPSLMRSADPFIRELACLHGIGQIRHPDLLETAFDQDEALAMDAVDQLQQSDSE